MYSTANISSRSTLVEIDEVRRGIQRTKEAIKTTEDPVIRPILSELRKEQEKLLKELETDLSILNTQSKSAPNSA